MRFQGTNQRRGVILMVVLSLLTLFAIVGLAFVLYADAEATSARIAREGETLQRADMNPEQALAFFLGQLLYDVNDDVNGAGSALRGHSLGRTMYGYNYTMAAGVAVPGANVTPYNGVGRLHYTSPVTYTPAPLWQWQPKDDYGLVNYTWFAADGFVRDPERIGSRLTPANTLPATQTNPYVGGNASYTYPDLNSFFLAAVNSQGAVLTPSFHRPWLFQQVSPIPGVTVTYAFNDMTNPNWYNQGGKYLTARPRPADHAGFPPPADGGGDVKNLVGAPGGTDITGKPFNNDSIWMDLGAPIMTAPDGTLYKPLFAPLIMDLDNRINVAAAGNIAGNLNASRSNQGWFSTETNIGQLWSNSSNAAEWQNLLQGNGTYYGKYGPSKVPSAPFFLPIGQTPSSSGSLARVRADGHGQP